MTKFLTTTGNSYHIEQIILNAESSITIVTPYLKLSSNIMDRLRDADRHNITMTFIYGKNKLSKSENEFLDGLDNLEIFFCKNLHAKCYHNESRLIISSMNLYEFSERNNREMGVLVEKSVDQELYEEALKEIESIKNSSIQEKRINKNKDTINIDYRLDARYNELRNYHLPSLYSLLKNNYPDIDITLDEDIRINDFPRKGVDLIVTSRVELKLDRLVNYQEVRKKNENILHSILPQLRIYWNNPSIHVYLESNYKNVLSREGVEDKSKYLFGIIDSISQYFSI